MMRSMFSGVSGLRVHQMKMDVIANNIANVNTHGYKTSRMTFTDVFNQTLSGATGSDIARGRGGQNPNQIGLGANIGSIDLIMTQGTPQRTDAPLDMFIEGEGFFIVADQGGQYFTRNGAFHLDNDGYIANAAGQVLQGWKAQPSVTNPGTFEIDQQPVRPIRIGPEDERIGAEQTTSISVEGKFNPVTDDSYMSKYSFHDSKGNNYTIDVNYVFVKGTGGVDDYWDIQMGDRMYLDGDTTDGGTPLTFALGTATVNSLSGNTPVGLNVTLGTDTHGGAGLDFVSVGRLQFDTEGNLISGAAPGAAVGDLVSAVTGLQLFIETNTPAGTTPPNGFMLDPDATFGAPIHVDFATVTESGGQTPSELESIDRDGREPGELIGYSVGTTGIITGRYSNGLMKELWQIPIAQFQNPAGLEKVGNNLFVVTQSSGDFNGTGITAGAGTRILGGTLEMANVDLAQEFTEMITAQRGFQANSRTITTSDEMLQELVNLKR